MALWLVWICALILSAEHNFTKTFYLVIVLESNYFAMWGFALRETEARDSGLSTNYRKEPCIFYYLVYLPINGPLDLDNFN